MEIITAFGFACIATMAFAVLFQAPKKIVLIDGVIGAIGWVFLYTCGMSLAIHRLFPTFAPLFHWHWLVSSVPAFSNSR